MKKLQYSVGGTLLGRLLSLLVAQYIAWRFGATSGTDAIFLALSIVIYGGEIVRLSIEPAVVPQLVRITAQDRHALSVAHKQLTRAAALWGLGMAAAVATVGSALALLAHGSVASELGRRLLQLSPIGLVLGTIAVDTAVLNTRQEFFSPGATMALGTGATLAILAISSPRLGLAALPLAYVAGWALRAGSIHRAATTRPLDLRPPSAHRRSAPLDLRILMLRMAPVALGGAFINLNPIIDRFVAILVAGPGSVTIFELSSRIFAMVGPIMTMSLGSVFLVQWSDANARGGIRKGRQELIRTMRLVGPLLLLGTALLYFITPPVFRLLFARGSFSGRDVEFGIEVAQWLVIALPPFIITSLLARFIYSAGDTRFALISATVGLALNVPLDIAFGRAMGLSGIAVATVADYSCIALLAVWWIRRLFRNPGGSVKGAWQCG